MSDLRWLLALLFVVSPLGAQQPDSLTLRVVVTDSGGRAIERAEVSAVQGLATIRAAATTAASGIGILRIPRVAEPIEVVARRIGYTRASVFVTPARDTTTITIQLRPSATTIAGVKVTERESITRRAYHVDADDIANSSRPIFDGMDVLLKLRPDIVYGRAPGCAVANVWVNGKRIYDVPIDPMVEARRPHAPDPRMRSGGRPLPASPLSRSSLAEVWTVLASIKPEHIEEMNFADCFNTDVNRPHAQNALFVVLKTGIGFEPGVGSYVIAPASDAPSPQIHRTTGNAYRDRVLGVFDEATGEPIAGAVVTDSSSGTTAATSATGTVSLLFLPEGNSTLRITQVGYADLKVPVSISPRDTVPITLVMRRR
ncbi:MAG TPA: carboxypeptidase regulatory-like domain-containing protein [Gemmatimonadaceae bacterium]|jgi:hypothetical protein|nr:carboxypeptidase regulatory-like domain-containing protein [Gemmatimonadaceae bacterium]